MSVHIQLKNLYENDNLSPEEIAEDQGLDLVAVKSALMQSSSRYRKDCGLEPEGENRLNFTEDEQVKVKNKLLEIAFCAEDGNGKPDYRLMADLLKYIRDDGKGRKDVVRAVNNTQFNILEFNEKAARIREITGAARARLIEA